jgi:hypothetical protein
MSALVYRWVWVEVPTDDQGKNNYRFHREELLLYMLLKMKDSLRHTTMADKVTGGDARRWSYGYKYIVHYIDKRYEHLIGPNGMRRWITKFPEFAEKIRQAVARYRLYVDEEGNMVYEFEGCPFDVNDFRVVGFLDCKDRQTRKPRTGPAGDYQGAMRKTGSYLAQRAVYCGHHHHHGVRVLTFSLPNGMTAAVYGPTSVRRHDVTLLNWSRIDEVLSEILGFLGMGNYAFYGDAAYTRGRYHSIVARHDPTPLAPLNERQKLENQAMKKVRISVEWSYQQVGGLWKLSEDPDAFKLEQDPAIVCAQIRVMHLLTNCYTCIHGNTSSSSGVFACEPPELEDYLVVVEAPLPFLDLAQFGLDDDGGD